MADSPLPPEVATAPASLKADRAYQIATAYFYRFDYARAAELYAAIGRDTASPWSRLAGYLTARAAVHGAIFAFGAPTEHLVLRAGIPGLAVDQKSALRA
jgi:hypothetical protein